MDKRILVIGGSGMVGSAIMRRLRHLPNTKVLGTYYTQQDAEDCVLMDLANPLSIGEVFGSFSPQEVYLTAAFTDVDVCEHDTLARKINVDGVRDVVKLANRSKAKICMFSTSYVFDGTQVGGGYSVYDTPHPINSYGLQKMLGEKSVLNDGLDGNIVIRTVGVFGHDEQRKNFGYKVVDNLLMGSKVYAPDDQFMNPIYVEDLASASIRAMELGYMGVMHIAGSEYVSKYDFALDIAQTFELPTADIIPVKSDQLKQLAKRPFNACLRNTMTSEFSYTMGLGRFKDAF